MNHHFIEKFFCIHIYTNKINIILSAFNIILKSSQREYKKYREGYTNSSPVDNYFTRTKKGVQCYPKFQL